MKLLPSLKQKKRYIIFEIIGLIKISFSDLNDSINKSILNFVGELGKAKLSPLLIKEKFKDKKFIIKVNHSYVDECKSAIILIKKIKNNPVVIKSIAISGTLKKASNYLK
tara:strand:- start:111 stop:440 length:330 start_codon:yes stop_codon:yes gene_type:complete